MTDTRLSSLALLAIESELVKNIDFNDLINEFARIKQEKKCCKCYNFNKKSYNFNKM